MDESPPPGGCVAVWLVFTVIAGAATLIWWLVN